MSGSASAAVTPPLHHHPAFEFRGSHTVTSLDLGIDEYRHLATGARHFHFRADDDNNAFLVALLTVPRDSTGVAHILEHTSLCGSERYPVRDPFFMMLRRSLNTFMNAFTASDWTAYPFATQNRKDFYNLLDVYLDAVFFPRLDPLDFAQEGHRVEFEQADDPHSPLIFKGVVYNEMKGAMSSPVAQLWQTLQSELFPTNTYHYNSGGDPEAIPDLSHAELRHFHARHYHPSNALFVTYGNLPVDEHQRVMELRALSRFQAQDMNLAVADERRYRVPKSLSAKYALEGEQSLSAKTHVVLGWLLGHGADLEQQLTAQLLAGVLLDNSSSPLRYALETTDLGAAPSELCGLDDSTKEMVFVCGLEGSESSRAAEVEALIMGVLEQVARDGIDSGQVDAVLHQLELEQREIKGGGFPYGLRLIVNTLGPTLHGGAPAATLDIDPVLNALRERIADPDYIRTLIREQLLDNPHRIRLDMAPDPELNQDREQRARARLQQLRERMNQHQVDTVVSQAAALRARQQSEDDPEILPRVELSDVPAQLAIPEPEAITAGRSQASWYQAATNGMVYQQVVAPLSELAPEMLRRLSLFCGTLGELGSGGRDYLQTQARQAAVTGGIGAHVSIRSSVDDLGMTKAWYVVSGKALKRNHEALSGLLLDTWYKPRFDELGKLRELVSESRAQREMAVTGHGHSLAMTAACATMNTVSALSHGWDGLLGLQQLKSLDDRLGDDDELRMLGEDLQAIHTVLSTSHPEFLLIAEADQRDAMVADLSARWEVHGSSQQGDSFETTQASYQPVREAWSTATQVNFCAMAYPTVAQGHADAAALVVLGGFLRNGFLHRTIREQGGAYGGGASYDPDAGAFRFFSYRDPRLAETLDDFDRAIDWLLTSKHPQRALEEAILGVAAAIDRPNSPAGEAAATFFANLHGRTPERRRAMRQRILEVSLDQLKDVTERYLTGDNASIAVISDASTLENNMPRALQLMRL